MNTEIIASESYNRAIALSRSIIANAHAAQMSLYEMCKELKEMHDKKLYTELGYQSFEEYAETEIGMTKRNANRYVAVAEMVSENGTLMSQNLGITKLYLLSTLSEPDRENLQQTTAVETVSVSELKNKIKELQEEKDRISKEAELDRKEQEDANAAAMRYKEEANRRAEDQQRLEGRVRSLESQIKELEQQPIEVAVSDEAEKEVEKLKKELEQTQKARDRKQAELIEARKEFEEKLEEAQRKSVEPEILPDNKATFKAYYSNAIDSINRLFAFMDQVSSEEDRKFCIDKIYGLAKMIQNKADVTYSEG